MSDTADQPSDVDSRDVDPEDVDAEELYPEVPDWDDEYLDRVSDRLMFNYDLERDRVVAGEQFDLYGDMRVESYKQVVHPSVNYANHAAEEHLFARRQDAVRVADVERLVELGHELADRWIDANEEHYGTDFSFVVVAPEILDEVREFVDGFRERELLKFGYYGHYEVNLVVVAPEREEYVASSEADVASAFVLWEDVQQPDRGFLRRLISRLVG